MRLMKSDGKIQGVKNAGLNAKRRAATTGGFSIEIFYNKT